MAGCDTQKSYADTLCRPLTVGFSDYTLAHHHKDAQPPQ